MGSDNSEPAQTGTFIADHTAGQSPGSSTAKESGRLNDRVSLQIDCLRNARYHEDRERFFARVHKCSMFIVVVSGTATFAFAKATPWLAGAITLVGLLDLVFDLSGKARLHASLRRRIYEVLAQAQDETRDLIQLREQAVRVYADEPPCMHAVNAVAYNGAMDSFDRPRKSQLKLEWYHRWFRHVWSFASTDFKTYEELEASRQV